jgi:hypothetical protein
MSLMDGQMDMHTLAKQMGTSAGMLEQRYSKMTATMAADRSALILKRAADVKALGSTDSCLIRAYHSKELRQGL